MTIFGGLVPSSESQQTQQTLTYRVLDFMYGNGYESIIPDGANATVDTWQITFDNLGPADSATLDTWLADSPPWVTFSGDGVILSSARTYRVTNDGFQKLPMAGDVNSYTFNLQEVF